MACLLLAGVVLAGAVAGAPPMPVPAPAQAALLLKVLTADRNLPARSPEGLAIGVVYQRGVPASRAAAEEIALEIGRESRAREGAPVRVSLVDVTDPSALAPALAALRPSVLYVAPLEGFDVGRITALSRAGKIRTATGVPPFVASGLALGFEPAGHGVRILINREASRAEGADFGSKLLKLARPVP